jgi:hypothetical protein
VVVHSTPVRLSVFASKQFLRHRVHLAGGAEPPPLGVEHLAAWAVAMDALATSPFALLDARSNLRLVTDAVREDDALCLALACRALRDALWARFPRRLAGDAHAGRRLRTRKAALVVRVARLVWARGLAATEDALSAASGMYVCCLLAQSIN